MDSCIPKEEEEEEEEETRKHAFDFAIINKILCHTRNTEFLLKFEVNILISISE